MKDLQSARNELEEQVAEKKQFFQTESYQMSIGELISLYENKELIVSPKFQRFFRWNQRQKSRFIESILLGIPIPQIFVYQNEDEIWEVVDGLQRVSTLISFIFDDQLKSVNNYNKLVLSGTSYLPGLEGVVWQNPKAKEKELPDKLKLAIKRTKLGFSIIKSESDVNAKYEVFQRLNTGGTFASAQEVRNSVMVMLNPEIYDWFEDLSNNEIFKNLTDLSENQINARYDMELILRFVALTKFNYDSKGDLKDYFDDVIVKILKDPNFPTKILTNEFSAILTCLEKCGEDGIFRRYSKDKGFSGRFSEAAFEIIMLGLYNNLDSYRNMEDGAILLLKIQSLHEDAEYLGISGSGSNAKSRIPKLAKLAKRIFN